MINRPTDLAIYSTPLQSSPTHSHALTAIKAVAHRAGLPPTTEDLVSTSLELSNILIYSTMPIALSTRRCTDDDLLIYRSTDHRICHLPTSPYIYDSLTAIAVAHRAGLHPNTEVVPTSLVPTPQKNIAGAPNNRLSLPDLRPAHHSSTGRQVCRYARSGGYLLFQPRAAKPAFKIDSV